MAEKRGSVSQIGGAGDLSARAGFARSPSAITDSHKVTMKWHRTIRLSCASILLPLSLARAQGVIRDHSLRRSCAGARPLRNAPLANRPDRGGFLVALDSIVAEGKVRVDSAFADTIPHCVSMVEVLASGNVKDALGTKGAAAVANGALGLHFAGSNFDVRALVNVASTNDTVRAQYGSTLLVPATGGGINAAELRIRGRFASWEDPRCARYDYNSALCNMGYRLALDASTREWATRFDTTIKTIPPAQGSSGPTTVDTTVLVRETARVPMWGASVSLWYEFFRGDLRGTDSSRRTVALLLDVGASYRALRGDIAGDDFSALRKTLLQESRTAYLGFETALAMTYNNVTSRFTYYWFPNCKARGLCGGQIVAAVSLDASIASELLRRD